MGLTDDCLWALWHAVLRFVLWIGSGCVVLVFPVVWFWFDYCWFFGCDTVVILRFGCVWAEVADSRLSG